MTATGHKARAEAIEEQIRRRHEIRHETTREVATVTEQLPVEAIEVIEAVGYGTIALRREVDELRAALETIATQNAEQLRQVLERVADVHRKSVDADNVLINELKGLAQKANG